MGPNGEEMETAAIITMPATGEFARLHERMPVIVPPEAFDLWLDCSNVDATTAAALFAPAREGLLDAYEVSPAVNRADNDGPQLIEPAPAQHAQSRAGRESAAPSARKKTDERQSSLF